jgi:hypothetical protein
MSNVRNAIAKGGNHPRAREKPTAAWPAALIDNPMPGALYLALSLSSRG